MGKAKGDNAKARKKCERRMAMMEKGKLMTKKIKKRPRKKRTFKMKDMKDALEEVKLEKPPKINKKKQCEQRNEVLKRERGRLKTFLKASSQGLVMVNSVSNVLGDGDR